MLTSKKFRYKQASCWIAYVTDTQANLHSVLSENRGNGEARGLLELVCAFADTHHIRLDLMAQRYHYHDGVALDNAQLILFYSKFGFVSDDHYRQIMSRQPQGEELVKTMTFIFIEEGHGSHSIVTAETEDECVEKYFLKYPERRDAIGNGNLTVLQGEVEINFGLGER